MFDPAEVISGLPHRPGVYRMLNAAGEALYVGKALDLRKRVASYFQKQEGVSPRIQVMLGQVAAIETTVTRSEAEALLLENNLIKSLAPRYNILFRDDKSYPYLVVTGHRYPRLGFHRGVLDERHRYFGPFPNAGAVRESIQLLQKVFRIRTCEDTVFTHRSRPCLLHQIRRCTAPCVGLVRDEDYADDVRSAGLFLSGREDEVLERLAARMAEASERLHYEQAAAYRDQIAALRKVVEKQFVSGQGSDADIIACSRAAGVTCVNMVMIRGGHHLGDRNFFPRNADDATSEQVLEAFVVQHYLEHAIPSLIVAGAQLDAEPLEQLLAGRAGRVVRIATRPTGPRRAWLDMALRNAQFGAEQKLASQATQEARLTALQQAFDLPDTAQRIECFDVSHTMGEATVASCVVYDRSAMQKGEYRRYNIAVSRQPSAVNSSESTDVTHPSTLATPAAAPAGIEPGDDYAAMKDVLTRRYRKVVAGEGKVPDLVLIDGGKGQLSVAREVFADIGLADVAIVAVSKGEERKPGLEQLWPLGRSEPVHLARDHPALHLIQQIRDEAHRFAIQGHRARRGKARSTSTLESISGVGAKRRQKLLARFGGLRGLLAASVDDLAQVEGINRTLAERIYHELH
ncbi:MAG TPA: excinuclease ABC subunit UvrC [Burkholderiales bacterium]|nr:excinuclease ABC subunit UvrC [Burkholderiales bacterium]